MKTYVIFNESFFLKKPWWIPKKLYLVVCQRSNPRSKDYMMQLLRERFSEVEILDTNQTYFLERIVLLYPDSIGLGWKKVEKKFIKQGIKVEVLNGRRRSFELTSAIRRQLSIRRFLEMTFLPEILLMPFLLICGVLLAIKDKLCGGKL